MTLVKRGVKGSPVSAAEYDAVVDQVETNKESIEVLNGQFNESEVTLSFTNLAAATAYWTAQDGAGNTPTDGVLIYIEDVKEDYKWLASDAAKAVATGRVFLEKATAIAKGNTGVATSGDTFDFGNQISENKNIIPNADFRGFVSLGSSGLVGYSTNGSAELVKKTDVPKGFSTKAVKVPINIGDNKNVYTGTLGTDIILEDADKYSCGIWIYNDNWAGYDGLLYCIDTHTNLYFEANVIDINNGWKFYYANNQTFTLANGGIQLRVNMDGSSATVNTNFYISSPVIIQGDFVKPKIYLNFLDTLNVEDEYVTKTFLTNDQFFQEKNYLVDKDASYSSDELTIIDAIVDIIPTKIPSGELSDEFALTVLASKQTNGRITIKNVTTDTNVFTNDVSLGERDYGGGVSLISEPTGGAGTHGFNIYLDWSKIPSDLVFVDSLSNIKINVSADNIKEPNNISSKQLHFLPIYNDFKSKNWSLWGDSISNTESYWRERANQYLQMEMDNNAVGGDRIYEQTDDLDTLLAGDATYFDDKPLVTFMCIYNTWNTNYALGNVSDSTATASYCGKLKYFIETVIGANNLTHLVLMTQYITSLSANTNGDTLLDFNEKTREIAKLYGCPVIDWGAESGCNEINVGSASVNYDRATFTQDAVHPSRWGSEVLAKLFVKGLINKVGMYF